MGTELCVDFGSDTTISGAICEVFHHLRKLQRAKSRGSVSFRNQKVFPNNLVPILALIDHMRRTCGVSVDLRFPEDGYVEKACVPFVENQWDPSERDLPAHPFGLVWSFSDGRGINRIVNAYILALRQLTVLGKGVIDAITWGLNEVMDNVLNHSSADGEPRGYVMAQFVPRNARLSVCVCDCGQGLYESLRQSVHRPHDTAEAIRLALSKGVTRNPDVGQGNGLWGLSEIIKNASSGRLLVQTGGIALRLPAGRAANRPLFAHSKGMPVGTVVDFQLTCNEDIPFDAIFPDNPHLTDLWLENLEESDDSVRLVVRTLIDGCGTRVMGRALRTMVENMIEVEHKRVTLDFDGVESCSSSFADELVGRLALRYGFVDFCQLVRLENTSGLKKGVVNLSIAQRLSGKTV